jgi:hypothetical protein
MHAYLDPISNTLYTAGIYKLVAWNFYSFMGTQGKYTNYLDYNPSFYI